MYLLFRNGGRVGCGLILAAMLAALCCTGTATGTGSPSALAVWVTHPKSVEGVGSLEEYLLDRLGSNGLYPVIDPEQAWAAGSYVGLDGMSHYDLKKLTAIGRALKCRWVLWVKVVDRGVDFKKGLSIPHLFVRRKAVSRMLVDARIVDVHAEKLLASRRWRLDKSGAGSYQVAEDVRQDPVYNNSANQFYQDGRRLEWESARNISRWFKSVTPRGAAESAPRTQEEPLDRGPFMVEEDEKLK